MGNHRMFSVRIANSARFLKMPICTQCLYFHLGLRADDDGIVEAYTVMNSVGASEDDLRVLASKDFVRILNDDLVTYITDWRENNQLRADRKRDSIYQDLLLQKVPDVELLERKPRADVGRQMDVRWTSNGRPNIRQEKISEEKISEEKEREENNICALQPQAEAHFESAWSLYPKKKVKKQVTQAAKNDLAKHSMEEIERAINRYLKDLEREPWRKAQNGSTFFNGGIMDYYDDTYTEDEPIRAEDREVKKWADSYKALFEED